MITSNRVISMADLPAEILESAQHQKLLSHLDLIKPQAKGWSVARRNAFAFESAKAIKDLKAQKAAGVLHTKNKGLMAFVESVRQAPDFAHLATEANTSADFQVLSSQILTTYADLMERFHISDLVSIFSMTAPRAYIERQTFRYADDAVGYDAGSRISPNVDPDYADSPGECQVANKVKMTNSLETLDAVAKRLAADWSVIAEQDAAAMFSINLRGGLRQAMVDLILRAYQQDYLLQMINGAGHGTTWLEAPQGAYTSFLPEHWANTLYSQALVDINVAMRQDADVRAGVNVLAGNASEIARFARMREYRLDAPAGNFNTVSSQTSNDTLKSADARIDTALNGNGQPMLTEFDYMPANRLLAVRKDDSRPAFIHAPLSYAAETDLGEFTDPETGCRRIGLMSRAGSKLALPNAIGLITITPAT